AQEPMVDPLASLLDPGVLLSLQEWAEWGDPAEEESVYRALRACSPAENVGAGAYPAGLARAGPEGGQGPCTAAAVWVAAPRAAGRLAGLRARPPAGPARGPCLVPCARGPGGGAQARRTAAMAWLLEQLGAPGWP